MTILILVHGLPVGGTETVVCGLVRWLAARGHRLEVGCLDEVGSLGERLRDEGFTVTSYQRKPGRDWALPFRIAAHVRRSGADLVHAHQTTCYVYGILATLVTRTPLVFTEHGRFHPDEPSSMRRAFNRVFARRIGHVTAVSGPVRESLIRVEGFSPDGIELVPNGVDPERFRNGPSARRAARERLGLPADGPVIGTVGRLHSDKNQASLLRAAGALSAEFPDLRTLIVGDGPERSALESLAGELGLCGRVLFLGECHDVDRILPALDVFVLPSITEGMPVTLLEAMATGVPIVATAVGGIPEILTDEHDALLLSASGNHSDPTDTDPLAERIASLLRDPDRRRLLAETARARVRADFSTDAVFARYEGLYQGLVR